MKREGNLFQQICSIENLELADLKACKGKLYQKDVQRHLKNREANILAIHEMLINKTYHISGYYTFPIYEPKERIIYRLGYYPHRIIQHAMMNPLEPIFVKYFTADTYSCIKGRGIHGAARAVRKALCDEAGTRYYLKLDIKKFYPSINHTILKQLLRRKFKDNDLLWLLDVIIDSADGLPIGNYLSQYLANFYLTPLDRWLKQVKRVRHYFRYADDMVIFSDSKEYLHQLRKEITDYLDRYLKLTVKENYRVSPVHPHGLDFVGYVFLHTHTLLRPSIKHNFARKVARGASNATMASYYGWTKHCSGRHLFKTLTLTNDQRFQRLRYQKQKFHRRENKYRPNIERSDSNRSIQN